MITKISTSLKFLNKPIRVISSLVIALAMVFSSMAFVDFNVKAEDPTYYEVNANSRMYVEPYVYIGGTVNARLVVLQSGSTKFVFLVSDQSFTGYWYQYETGSSSRSANSFLQDGYYVSQPYTNQVNSTSLTANPTRSGYSLRADAVYYTFGAGSVDPGPNITYGDIKDLAYSTQIVGSGGNTTGDSNLDVITWYPYWDTNENIAINWTMEIEVLPASYSDVTQQGLLMKTSEDVSIDWTGGVNIYNGAYSNGTLKVTWGQMKTFLAGKYQGFGNLFSWFDGQYWNKIGWVYRARFTDPDNNYTSEWQYIYTVTSSSGTGVEEILDPNTGTGLPDFYNNVTDSYNDIFNTTAVTNNNYNQVFYVNNAPYVVNPSEEPEDNTTNEILEEILRVTIQIRQLIQQDQNDGDERQPDDTGLKDKDDELHDREQELIDDMDDKLEDIDTDVELINNTGFLAAANWVRLQYDHLTLNTPFELVIVFALVLGIALIFIGKVR